LVDANRLLLFEFSIEPSLDYYIFHIGSVGNRFTHYSHPSLNNRIDLLRSYLLKFYPPDHEVILISAATSAREGSHVRVPLCRLEVILAVVHYASTLFVPGLRPSSFNRKYLDLLTGLGPQT